MESFNNALYEYIEKDFKIVLNKYCNEMANQIFEKSKDKQLSEKEIMSIMNNTLNEHSVKVHVLGKKKVENKDEEGNVMMCVELLTMGANKGNPCGKKCCSKSQSLCSIHHNKRMKAEEKQGEVKKSKK